ncbi:uncharacterized protein LOC100900262 [Galendromus occidentalis]|uniref:Uncharacterized protein LOC100900262 n=1 Tax=Galendromus occidentalis TaxID=34638 RepID=A0AAJ7L528_9ACAR|nr:uncharacterized protein LOC100900262 [Galendromus occidentalis]
MSKKRPRVDDSDDDQELWDEAVLVDDYLVRTQATQQMAATTSSAMQIDVDVPRTASRATADEMQKKIDNLIARLMAKAKEKLELKNEVNRLRAANADFCEKNCKKQLNAVNCDLRFKENELSSLRKRVKELSTKLECSRDSPMKKNVSPISSQATHDIQRKKRIFPTIKYTPHPDLEILEDFTRSDPSDEFARKQFIRWSGTRGDTEIDGNYLQRIDRCLPEVYAKVLESQDPALWAGLVDFLSGIQDASQAKFHKVINWREFLSATDRHQALLRALICFLRTAPDATTIYPNIRSFILFERNWRCQEFESLLSEAMDFVQNQSLSYDGEYVAKEILRVYRQILSSSSDPDVLETLMTSSLKLMFQGADLDGELVSVVTRAEAFHHLGDVLKKVIRWQPTVSRTGCPEMMEIAEMSFRDT